MLRRLLDNPWTYFSLAGLLFVALVVTQFEVRVPPRPKGTVDDIRALAERDDVNLVFILVDTLRADRVHAYGYERETSPMLDYLANTGIRFDRVVSQSSWTKTSMASMWTATWPQRTGILRWNHALGEEVETPAERLQQAGFVTAGIWRNGWVAPNFGFSQGFQTYVKPTPRQSPDRFKRGTPSTHPLTGTDEDLTYAMQEFVRAYRHKRFFLYVHMMDVHQYAYDEASALFGTDYSDTYDNAIHWTDRNIATMLQELQKQEIWDRTIVVIASDHGEGFREHGVEGHARTVYGEVAYVPWIVALPFELQPGVVVDQLTGNVDIWPTLYDLLGLPIPEGVDGRSKLPAILAAAAGEEASPLPDRAYFSHIDRQWGRPTAESDPLIGVSLGAYRYIKPVDPVPGAAQPAEASAVPVAVPGPGVALEDLFPKDRGKPELYDSVRDPGETRDLLAVGRSVPPEVEQALAGYLENDTPPWGRRAPEVELDEMELNQLRALGYVLKP